MAMMKQWVAVERKMRDGRVVFDLEGEVGGKDYWLRIAADGEVIEAEMPISSAPKAVRDAAAREVEGIELRRVQRDIDDGEVIFEVKGRVGKDRYTIRVSPVGEILGVEMPLGQVPQVSGTLRRMPWRESSSARRPGARRTKRGSSTGSRARSEKRNTGLR